MLTHGELVAISNRSVTMVAPALIRPSRRATGGASVFVGTWSRMGSISRQGVSLRASASRDFVGDQDFRGRRRTWFRAGADRPRQMDRASTRLRNLPPTGRRPPAVRDDVLISRVRQRGFCHGQELPRFERLVTKPLIVQKPGNEAQIDVSRAWPGRESVRFG
jgi:hypothetical protein